MLFLYQDEETPLMMSITHGNIEICKLLINNGALPSINTPDDVNI